ncbi:hypothetical protein KI387_032051 [Taxus chinensis]|uniref:Uncharacterized protein n=1 Tax=Taxus chinensis TaxID=29808 RepID=A0AA38EZ06_TAXCH|nr:hypothetical protein KI387_032051 [Taxus chinensis]
MDNLACELNKLLPYWLEKTHMERVQWIYAIWQIVRCNSLTLLALSFLPYYLSLSLSLRRGRKRKAVVVLGDSKDYNMSVDEMRGYFSLRPLKDLEIISSQKISTGPNYVYWVMHGGYYYITHGNTLCELAKCYKELGEDIIFVERALPITATLSVGNKLSQTEGYEKILSRRYHCSKGTDCVIPTWFDYVDLNGKFWGVLSTVPLFLQAKEYYRLSNLVSLVIILFDCNRSWMYGIYSGLFDSFVKWVKLNVFKETTALYNFFSIFSSRWRYCDTVKKHAYVAQPGDVVNLRCYSKLESMEDLEIVNWKRYTHDTNDQNICMEIVKDKGHWSLIRYKDEYAEVKLNKPVYVSDHSLSVHSTHVTAPVVY